MIPTRLIALSFVALLTGFSAANARPQLATETAGDNNGHWTSQIQIQPASGHSRKPHRHYSRAKKPRIDANGNDSAATGSGVIRSHKTGATARVAPRHQAKFQAYIDDLEAHGAAVYYMGGIRPGHCSLASQHPCGGAVDVCQDYRGHVSGARDCHLPRPVEMAAIARSHGLYEGSVWCNSDYGHAQAVYSGGCSKTATGSWGGKHYATMTGKIVTETSARKHHRHHRRVHYARKIQSVSAY